ncbi:MAG: bacteriophage holin [Candidatus Omnitrophota bacterium]
MKLDAKALGLSMGIVWGGALIVLGVIAMIRPSYCADFVAALGSKYIGYNSTPVGSLIGGIWGFLDAGIGGVLIAWLYNKFSK